MMKNSQGVFDVYRGHTGLVPCLCMSELDSVSDLNKKDKKDLAFTMQSGQVV